MKITILRVSGSTATTLACTLLLPMGAHAQSISTTGPDSTNIIKDTNSSICKVLNSNDVDLTNNNPQSASSGDVKSDENTTVGAVTSGDASNSSDTSVNVSIDNSGGCVPEVAVTPTPAPLTPPVVMAPQVLAPVQAPAGGRGGGEVAIAPTSAQVVAPVGGVGAGAGGPGVLATVVTMTTASALWFAARIRRQFAGLFG